MGSLLFIGLLLATGFGCWFYSQHLTNKRWVDNVWRVDHVEYDGKQYKVVEYSEDYKKLKRKSETKDMFTDEDSKITPRKHYNPDDGSC